MDIQTQMTLRDETKTEPATTLSALASPSSQSFERGWFHVSKNEAELLNVIAPPLASLDLTIVDVEVIRSQEKKLRVTIEKLGSAGANSGVSIDDCANASKALDEPLELSPIVSGLFPTGYELEVSSPGLERSLKKWSDLGRFLGKRVRFFTFRPLTLEEAQPTGDLKTLDKQKNYCGELLEVSPKSVRLLIEDSKGVEIIVPGILVTKAHLDPKIDFSKMKKEKGLTE